MQVLLNKSGLALADYPIGNSQENITRHTGQSIPSKSVCLCCSYTLLRHIDLKGIYWRCSHCYQEMPVEQLLNNEHTDQLKMCKQCN